jgi:hypothetical protein
VAGEPTTGALVAGAVAAVTTVSVLEVSVCLDVEEESLQALTKTIAIAINTV